MGLKIFNISYSLVKEAISCQHYIDNITIFYVIFRFVQNVVPTLISVHVTQFAICLKPVIIV